MSISKPAESLWVLKAAQVNDMPGSGRFGDEPRRVLDGLRCLASSSTTTAQSRN